MSALHMESQLRPGTLTWSAFIVVFLLLINLGTWRVHEMAPTGETGWICSFPATADAHGCYHQETFARGANYPDNNFGNYKNATKSGFKFHDLNANGTWQQPAEPGLNDWVIRAYTDADGQGDIDPGETYVSQTTAGGGACTFSLKPGKYVMCEELQNSWTRSAPTTGADCSVVTGLGPKGYALTLPSGQIDSDNNFGNYYLHPQIDVTKTGPVFERCAGVEPQQHCSRQDRQSDDRCHGSRL